MISEKEGIDIVDYMDTLMANLQGFSYDERGRRARILMAAKIKELQENSKDEPEKYKDAFEVACRRAVTGEDDDYYCIAKPCPPHGSCSTCLADCILKEVGKGE